MRLLGKHDNLEELREVAEEILDARPLSRLPAVVPGPLGMHQYVVQLDHQRIGSLMRLRQGRRQQRLPCRLVEVIRHVHRADLGPGPPLGPVGPRFRIFGRISAQLLHGHLAEPLALPLRVPLPPHVPRPVSEPCAAEGEHDAGHVAAPAFDRRHGPLFGLCIRRVRGEGIRFLQ
jgi:hypothetical protein